MESIWEKTSQVGGFPSLAGELQTDVLIIGGGIAGILCAYELEHRGIDYALVEADRILSGVTAGTTAKITSQHGMVYEKLLRRFGAEGAGAYYRANQAALERYRELCAGLDCNFQTEDSFLYCREDPEALDLEMDALERIGAKAEWCGNLPLPFPVTGAIRFPAQASFHPLKFLGGISRGLRIYEHTRVLSFDGRRYQTENGSIAAQRTIVATHFPMWNKLGLFPLKLYQDRSYVLGLENAGRISGMYLGTDRERLSLWMAGDILLLGGASGRTGCKSGGWEELELAAKLYFPGAKIRYRWAAQDCMSLDGMPYIGQYSPKNPALFVTTGFSKWGMTGAMTAAMLLADLVQGRENSLSALFAPSRRILRPQLGKNLASSAWNLIRPTVPRCPHMGCALKWNRQERSWDCSCHGSRFAEDGKLLEGPAQGDLKRGKSSLDKGKEG